MNHEPTAAEVLLVAGMVDELHAEALIEEALQPRTSPQDAEIAALMRMAEESGDPVKAKAARILYDLYATGRLKSVI